MRRALVTLIAFLALAPAAGAQDMSPNVKRVAQLPEMAGAISINFIGDAMFVSTVNGVYAYDVTTPAAPALLGALPMQIWENEDVDVDAKRKRLFVARDPRQLPGVPSGTLPFGAVLIIDVSIPHAMTVAGRFTLPAGHTTTCVNACDFLWTGGPLATADQRAQGWTGRPIYATDVRDPANPIMCDEPIDTLRDDGVTAYAHDVQVDSRGVAWVSGQGGVRGYWTSGRHENPLTGRVEEATGCAPIPYGGSGSPEGATPSRFMHNAFRDPDRAYRPVRTGQTPGIPAVKARKCSTRRGSKAARKRCAKQRRTCARARRRGSQGPRYCGRTAVPPASFVQDDGLPPSERILYGTEENLSSECASSGRFVAYDLAGTFDGEGFRDIAATKHRMKVLDTWTPEKQEGSSGCASAHYFSSRGDGIFVNTFYEQGVRFLDVSDPTDLRQVGWYRPADTTAFAAYWHKGLVFTADQTRGVEVLSFGGGTASATRRAPALVGTRRGALRFDRRYLAGLCPLPGSSPQS